MINRLFKGSFLLTSLSLSVLGFVACDENYDLSKGVSTEMSIGGSMSIPVGQTDKLTLSEVIETNDDITVDENGAYAIQKNGSLDVNIPSVDPITITGITPEPVVVDIDTEQGTSRQLAPAAGTNSITVPLNYELEISSIEDIPSEILDLISVNFETVESTIKLVLTQGSIPASDVLKKAELRNFKLKLPEFIELGPGLDFFDYNTNTIVLNQEITSGEIALNLPISAIRDIAASISNGKIELSGKVVCSGELYCEFYDTPQNSPRRTANGKETNLQLTTYFDVPEIEVNSVESIFDADITIDSQVLSLGEIPEALTDDNTQINLNNVATTFEITNPTGVPFVIDLNFVALNSENQQINQAVDLSVNVPAAIDFNTPKTTKYYITNSASAVAPDGYEKILCENLGKLINKIPNSIQITPSVNTVKTEVSFFELNKAYDTKASYDVALPFDFGPNSQINYTETIDNIHKDLSDVSDYINEMVVTAEIENTIPMRLQLNATPYDLNGLDMSDRLEISQDIIIEAGNDNAPTQTTTIIIKEKTKGALAELDKVDLNIKGNTQEAQTILKPTQYVLIKLNAKLPNGINVEF